MRVLVIQNRLRESHLKTIVSDPYWIRVQSGQWMRIRIQEALYGGLGISKLQVFIYKISNFFPAVNFFPFLVMKWAITTDTIAL
jgi:hypothetical protein